MKAPDCTWFEAMTVADELDQLIAAIQGDTPLISRAKVRTLLVNRMCAYRNHAAAMHGKKPNA